MNSEESRLRTFGTWPGEANVDPRKIAKAGFYYTGRGTEVQCFSCGGRISDWSYGDRVVAVITRHKMLDPGCPFIKDPRAAGNVPLASSQRRVSESSQSSRASESDSLRVCGSSPESSRAGGESSPESTGRGTTLRGNGYYHREMYESEAVRLESFARWPLPSISPHDLAKAGFFYTGQADKVECYYCEGRVDGWEEGDCPLEEHRHHYPSCPYLLTLAQQDTGVHLRFSSFAGNYEELKGLGVQKHRVPRSPKYSTYEARLRSFKNWPPSIPQTPHQLAESGFYFTGRGDQVRCFHCDGGLRLWEAGDEPWLEHARWFSDCGFLFLVRGQQYIDEAVDSLRTRQPVAAAGRGVKRKQQPLRLRITSVTEQQLQAAMSSEQSRSALQMGLSECRVKMALKQKLESSGEMFGSVEELIGAAFALQIEEESDPEEVWSVSTLAAILQQLNTSSRRTPPNSPALLNSKSRVSPRREALSRQGSAGSDNSRPGPSPCPSSHQTISEVSQSQTHSEPPSSHLRISEEESVTDSRLNNIRSDQELSPSSTAPSKHSVPGDIEEELRRLREWRQCKVCMDSEVGVVLLPCGHLVTCVQCTHSLADCPLCRHHIEATVRTYLS